MKQKLTAMLREAAPHRIETALSHSSSDHRVTDDRLKRLSAPLVRLYRLFIRAIGGDARRLVAHQDGVGVPCNVGKVIPSRQEGNDRGFQGMDPTEKTGSHFEVGRDRNAVFELFVWVMRFTGKLIRRHSVSPCGVYAAYGNDTRAARNGDGAAE